MDVKVGLLFLLALGISWVCVDARSLVISDDSVTQTIFKKPITEVEAFEADARNAEVCTLCEEFTTQAMDYLGENKTQTEIIDTLHQACSSLHSFKQECITLVDYYAPLFFLEIAIIQPENFCRKMNLCDQMVFASPNSCTLCQEAVSKVLDKLEDPDTQLEIIEILLKICDATDKYAKKCKKLVFEYGPLILTNAEHILKTIDLCTTIHACEASADGSKEASSPVKISLLSEF